MSDSSVPRRFEGRLCGITVNVDILISSDGAGVRANGRDCVKSPLFDILQAMPAARGTTFAAPAYLAPSRADPHGGGPPQRGMAYGNSYNRLAVAFSD